VTENISALVSKPRDWAVGGITVAMSQDSIDIWLARHSVPVECDNIFLINLGCNDAVAGVDSANWVNDYLYIIDAITVKYSNAKIYITKPWRTDYIDNRDKIASYVDVVVAARTNVFAGDDETVWLEGGDNGATMTIDGKHYSAAGEIEKLVQIRTVLGY
jgi:hypothetical protein